MSLRALLQAFVNGRAEVVVVGGVAGAAHGATRYTNDIDFVYKRSADNTRRLVDILAPYHPYLRGAPPGLPFRWEEDTIKRGLNFTLTTDIGDIDLLGEITGGGSYEDILPFTSVMTFFDVDATFLNLDRLIYVKRAAGRAKDLDAICELEGLLQRGPEADR